MSKKTLEERKKNSAFLGNQEMDDVSFKYIFTILDTARGVEMEVDYNSEKKLTPKEAWTEGETYTMNGKRPLLRVYEQVTVGAFLAKPKWKHASPPSGQAASVPKDAAPPPSA